MRANIRRELKAFCYNFDEIRKILISFGAKKKEVIKQEDYFFNLPNPRKFKRLKLRIQNNNKTILFYYDANNKNVLAHYHQVILKSSDIKELLEEALGVAKIVLKIREVWVKDDFIFHLDKIKKLGNIFEIESIKDSRINKQNLKEYKAILKPYLGKNIDVSNEILLK